MSEVANSQSLIPMKAKDVLALLISEKPDPLKDVRVTGPLDLSSIGVPGPVRVHNCVFEDAVDATDARFARSVRFINCSFEKGLSLAHARIDGPLDLSGSVLKPMAGAAEMPFHDLHVEGCIEGTRLHVECGLNFSDLECGAAFRLHGAKIGGDLVLDSAFIEGELDLGDCSQHDEKPAARTEVSGILKCARSHIESRVLLIGSLLGGATFEQTQVGGTMLLCSGYYTNHVLEIGAPESYSYSLSLLGASLHGNLEIRGAKLDGYLRISNAEIRCNLVLKSDRNIPTGQSFQTFLGSKKESPSLRLASASVRGAVYIHNVNFTGIFEASNADVALIEIDEATINSLRKLSDKMPDGVLAIEGSREPLLTRIY